MADKSTLLRTFNAHFFDMLDDFIRIFPENADILSARTTFETVKRANPTAIIKVWYPYIAIPYGEVIGQGNVDYFFEKNYNEDVGHLANAGDIMKFIETMRGPVRSMSDSNKEHTIKYLQNLNKLAVAYMGSR